MPQSKSNSFYESVLGALIAAPTSIVVMIIMLDVAGEFAIRDESRTIFATASWLVFLVHSIIWRYVIRRIFDRLKISGYSFRFRR